jgi:hypothetical protein
MRQQAGNRPRVSATIHPNQMGHTCSNVLVHVVFATKNREKTLTAAIRERLHAYLAQVVNASHSQYQTVRAYIESQEDRHRRSPYESELISLVKRNEIEYDERYLWS